MIHRTSWKRRYEEALIEAWESGFHKNGEQITEDTYSQFENNMWAKFDESQLDGFLG